MTTPIEKAAEAVSNAIAPILGQDPTGPDRHDFAIARAVFESIDRTEVAQVMRDFLQPEGFELTESDLIFADRLIAHLTGQALGIQDGA